MESMKLTCHTRTPLGEMLLVANPRGDALCGLYLVRQKYFPRSRGAVGRSAPVAIVPERDSAVA
jgi:hypothetical protein